MCEQEPCGQGACEPGLLKRADQDNGSRECVNQYYYSKQCVSEDRDCVRQDFVSRKVCLPTLSVGARAKESTECVSKIM